MTFESAQQIKVYKKYPTIAIKYQLNGESIKKVQISFNNTDEFSQCIRCFSLWNITITEAERSDNRSSNTAIAQYQNMPLYIQPNGFNLSHDEVKSKTHTYVRPNFQEPLQLSSNVRPNFQKPLQPSSNVCPRNNSDTPRNSFVPSSQLSNNEHSQISPLRTFDSTSSRTIQRSFFSTLDAPPLSKSDSFYSNGSNLFRNGSFMYPLRQKSKLSLSSILNEDSDNQFLNFQPNPLVGSKNIDIDLLNNRCLKEPALASTPNTSLIAIEKEPSAIHRLNCVYEIKSVEADLIDKNEKSGGENDEIMRDLETYVKKRLQDQKFIELVCITRVFLLFAK